MTRDDSVLNTGATSASFGSTQEQKIRTELRDEKIEKRAKLKPAGEIVLAELQKDIDEAQNINYLNIEQMLTEEHFKSELMARKKYLEKLIELKNRFNNLLRENP
jgi:hypothetical protein